MHRTSLLLIYWPRIKPDKLLRSWRCKMKTNELYICFGHSWNQESMGLNGYLQLPKSYNLKFSAVYLLSVLHVWAIMVKKELHCSSSQCLWPYSFGVGGEDRQRETKSQTDGVQRSCSSISTHKSLRQTVLLASGRVWMKPWLPWNGELPTLILTGLIYPKKLSLQSKAASNTWHGGFIITCAF